MGRLTGDHIFHHNAGKYHKKNENINMRNKSMYNLKTLCVNQTINLKYAINAECLVNYTYTQLCETIVWEYYKKADAFYKIDAANHTELIYDAETRKVSKLYDQSLSQDNAEQLTSANQPTLCSKANPLNKRCYLEFNGSKRMISNIDFNPASGQDDIVNIFIVYKLNSFSGSYLDDRRPLRE